MNDTHLSFAMEREALVDRILIPKFYDPDLQEACLVAAKEFELPLLSDLLREGDAGSSLGDWVPKRYYGTGSVPYVRTSDLSGWRIRADFKKGLSYGVHEEFSKKQDVRPGDLLMVAHGTYLVGAVALVTQEDSKLVLQDHVFRLRLKDESPIDCYYLLAALSTAFVRRQVRARQFSADIIDKLGDRHLSIKVPLHREPQVRKKVSETVKAIIDAERNARIALQKVVGSGLLQTRERSETKLGFAVKRDRLKGRILIPKYYDPTVKTTISKAAAFDVGSVAIGSLVQNGDISVNTGVEVGKMAYGTGEVAFIRTSDIVGLEIRRDVRQGVNESYLDRYEAKAGVSEGDILVVRDGTYLVGNSAIITEQDLPALICGGIFRIRVNNPKINRRALLAALNLPSVRKQMRSKQFTRDVIDTLGNRFLEVEVPALNSVWWREAADGMEAAFSIKSKVKKLTAESIALIDPPIPVVLSGRPGWSMR